jgi:hypothetical protein
VNRMVCIEDRPCNAKEDGEGGGEEQGADGDAEGYTTTSFRLLKGSP